MWIIIIIFVLVVCILWKNYAGVIFRGGGFIADIVAKHRPANRKFITTADEPELRKFFDIKDPKVTLEGLYSVTPPGTAAQISGIIYALGARTIVDGTAGMGGNSIQFAKKFTHVTAVEMNPDNFEALQHNVRGLPNVTTVCADVLTVDPKADAIFMDPPWTGTDYKKHKTLKLYLSGRDVADVAHKMPVQYVVLKVPANFDWPDYQKINPNSTIQNIGNFKLIISHFSAEKCELNALVLH